VLERIVSAGIEAPTGCNAQLKQYVIVDSPAMMEKIRFVSKALTGAPAAIVLLVEPEATPYGEFWVQDASAAMENMLLAAVALGYAGCWIEGQMRRCEERLRQVLQVPENLRVWSLMPVGRPAAAPSRPEKSTLAEVAHYNRFGGSG
jgi:nitroreductase